MTAVTDELRVLMSPAQPCAHPGTADMEIGAADVYSTNGLDVGCVDKAGPADELLDFGQ